MRVKLLILFAFACAPFWALAQGFAGLGQTSEGFALPDPEKALEFPTDDGAHPDFRIEWWYITATLSDSQGRDFGVQWTLFRNSLSPDDGTGWQSSQVWMAHAAVTTADFHSFDEKLARAEVGQVGVVPEPFSAWIDDWEFTSLKGQPNAFSLRAAGSDFAYDLTLQDDGQRIFHGKNGYPEKSADGQASRYFSRPYLKAAGTISIGSETFEVSGEAWLDREWSSQALAGNQSGWDWFGLTLDNGSRLMAARVRSDQSSFLFGTLMDKSGTSISLGASDIAIAPDANNLPPTHWSLKVPDHGVDLSVRALNPNAWTGSLIEYWEGPVSVEGSHQGRGYLEMTGYR